jgi:thiol-disulfide isomerase/thioredoxin
MILLVSLTPFILWAAPFDNFMDRVMQSSQTDRELNSLVQEYLYKAQSLEDHRTLQNVWGRIDKAACIAHYKRLNKENPNNPDYAYLAIRLLDEEESVAGAQELVTRYPKFYWGYRVNAVNATARLNSEDAQAYLQSPAFTRDMQVLEQGLKEFPQDDYLLLAQAYRYRAEASPEQALGYIAALNDPTVIQSNFSMILEVCTQNRSLEVYQRVLNIMNEAAVASGSISQKESDHYNLMYMLEFIVAAEGLDAVGSYIAQNPELAQDGETLSYLATMYLEHDAPQQAMHYLEQALAIGAVNYPEMNKSPLYLKLAQEPQWQIFLSRAKTAWEQDADARTKQLLAGRISKPAPNWELPDISGTSHKLAELRDYIVILDFWAVWCGPCKMVMPNLSDWVTNAMPRGVKVFSVNVMESDVDKAKAYFQENNYAMTYLEGNSDVASAYGVRGIPHIVIIDKQGNIAWEQVGFSYDLEEKLSIWAQHLGQ